MKTLLLAILLIGCKSTIQCPDRTGCSYKALNAKGDTVTVYQVQYDGINTYNVGEPIKANECMIISQSGTMYTITSEATPIK